MYEAALNYYPSEFGGILVGCYVNNFKTCLLEDVIISLRSKSSRYSFERHNVDLLEKLAYYYNASPSLIYLGEWHSHPDGMPYPSVTDRKAMKQIVEDENVKIISPLLIILGITPNKYEVGLYVHHNKKIYKYEQQD